MRLALFSWKWRNCLSCVIDATKSSGWNYEKDPVSTLGVGSQERHGRKLLISERSKRTSSKTLFASSSGFPGSRNRGRATVKSTPFFP